MLGDFRKIVRGGRPVTVEKLCGVIRNKGN